MEADHVDHVVEAGAGRLQHGVEIVEGEFHLFGEIRLGRAVGAAADLARNEQQVAGADRWRMAVQLIQRPGCIRAANGFSGRIPAGRADSGGSDAGPASLAHHMMAETRN